MLLSQTAEYALRAVLYIARQHPSPVRASELADALEIPRNYLGKTLGHLARARVLVSTRGPAGGFRLIRPPAEVALADVTRAFAGAEPRRCLLGLGPCGQNPSCVVHQRWLPSAQMIDGFFEATTIADLLVPPVPPRPADVPAAPVHHSLLTVT